MQPGRMLLFVGLSLAAVGALWIIGERLGLGRLPGDLVIKRKNFSFYFPIVSSILLSLILTLLFNVFRK